MNKLLRYSLGGLLICGLFACAKDKLEVIQGEAPGRPEGVYKPNVGSLANPEAGATSSGSVALTALSKDKQSAELRFTFNEDIDRSKVDLSIAEESVVSKYATFRKLHVGNQKLLPAEFYDLKLAESLRSAEGGATTSEATATEDAKSLAIKLEVKNYDRLPYGMYFLPVVVRYLELEYLHIFSIERYPTVSPLSPENQKPLARGSRRGEPMKMMAFVEINDSDPRNWGNFVLQNSKKPVFDIIVFFAANMNYDAIKGKRYLHFNENFTPIVNNPELYIKPLQDKGIKVIFDILPNHQGVGYENFQSYEEALEFVHDVKRWTDKLGVDGWDIDEEYAKYNVRPELPWKGARSAEWYMKAFKEVMPDKILMLYEYGLDRPGGSINYNQYVDYSYSDYPWEYASQYGIPEEKYFSASIEASRGTGLWNIAGRARNNVERGRQGLMIFNIPSNWLKNGGRTAAMRVSQATQVFYGEQAVFEGPYYFGPKDK